MTIWVLNQLVSDSQLGVRYSNDPVIPAQVALRESPPDRSEGLRSRKKARTRITIEDAALALFERHGYEATTVEQIAELADVSTTTFFRYFPTKAEVLLSDHGRQLPALHAAIVGRPAGENDLVAVRRAVQEHWVAAIDPGRTARKSRLVGTSPMLQGLSYERGLRWLSTISDALAERHHVPPQDARCVLTSHVALAVLADAVEGWIAEGCSEDLDAAVDSSFEEMADLCRAWSRPSPRRA
jgi:AcrR family transcriptional regulator